MSTLVAVVLCYAHQEYADYCANALRGMDTILIDNGSPEPIRSDVCQVHRLAENRQASGGCNAAMEVAGAYDFAWLLCDDTLGMSASMARGLMDSLPRTPIAGIGPNFTASGWRHMKGHMHVDQVDWIECDQIIPLNAWRAVGEYDTRFPGWGMDIDWGLRAMKKNLRCFIDGSYSVSQRANVQRPTMTHKDPDAMARGLCEKYNVAKWETLVQKWL